MAVSDPLKDQVDATLLMGIGQCLIAIDQQPAIFLRGQNRIGVHYALIYCYDGAKFNHLIFIMRFDPLFERLSMPALMVQSI